MSKFRYAMVCASNMNRSMEAHSLLRSEDMFVQSYGVGARVKLPGPTQKEPNVYEFGTPYEQIYNELKSKDKDLYTRNGLLNMLERNMSVKHAPQRWQDETSEKFDIVVAFEERVFEEIVNDLLGRKQSDLEPILIINLDVKDNHEEAATAAPQALELCRMVEDSSDWEGEVDAILDSFEQRNGRRPLYTVCWR